MAVTGFRPYRKELAERYTAKRWWLGHAFGDILDRAADWSPHKEGIVTEEVRLTFGGLRKEVNRAAVALRQLGLRRGDRVIIQLPNWIEYILLFFALQKIGAVGVFALPRHSLTEISYLARLTGARAWAVPVTDGKRDFAPLIRSMQKEKARPEWIITVRDGLSGTIGLGDIIARARLPRDPQGYLGRFRPDPRAMANILLTGGTTGQPKGVPRDHNSHILSGYARLFRWELGSADTGLIATPLGHNAAHTNTLYPMLLAGGKVTVITGTGPKEILETVEREGITYICPVPAQMEAILRFPDFASYDLRSLRLIALGAAHASAELVGAVYKTFGDIQVINAYSMSEGPGASTGLSDSRTLRATTVGLPTCPYDHFKVVDEQEQEVPPGVEGELVCTGPAVFTGYYRASRKDMRETFTGDGYFKTGDMARKINEKGYLEITGRKKDIIIRGGENISAPQVEEWVAGHPHIDAAAVVGMPDPILGERICAYVTLRKGKTLTLGELVASLRDRGASVFLLPERIEIMAALPLTPIGKVDKKALREDIAAKLREETAIPP